jgi:hypothetical protein
VKIILNVLLSIWTPGAILISKKQISGYAIFLIFIIVEASSFAFGLHNLFSISLFLFLRFSLSAITIFIYLRTLNLPNNRLLYFIIVITVLAIQFIPYGFRTYKESNKMGYNFSPEIAHKMQCLEEKAITKTYENLPVFVSAFITNILTNRGCNENKNWRPGIYYLINSGGESIIFYDSLGKEHYFQDITHLKSEFESIGMNPLLQQLFCGFSANTSESLLKNACLKMQQIGFKRIKMIYIKDESFVEKNVFDSLQIRQIKQTIDNFIIQGLEPSIATIKATEPLLNDCPIFWEISMKITGRSYDEIKAKIINALKTNSKLRRCNIQNVIDYCFLTYCPWSTYGIVEIDINDFEKITKKTFN